MDKLKMQVQLHVKGCWSIRKINLHVLKIHQTNVKILLEGESIIRKDYLDYHNHNFFGLKMNLKWKKNSTFKLFMSQWNLMGIVLKIYR